MEGRSYLQPGMLLDGSSYRIVRVVGAGGFGVTYEAEDVHLGTRVAIKEYIPEEFSVRTREFQVRPSSRRQNATFEWGRASFMQEARTLAQFKHPSVVRVLRIFEANSTAYMVMEFEDGPSFEKWLRDLGRPPSQDELDHLIDPLLDALEIMYAKDFLHRDIAPDNIIIRSDNRPVLLDFGAARKSVAAKTHAMTGMVKAGYSPQEQYSTEGKHQGPWSDFYALGATLYRAVTGVVPDQAPDRVLHDAIVPAGLAAKGRYRKTFLEAIDACMRVKPADRPKNLFQVRQMLLARDGATRTASPLEPTRVIPAEAFSRRLITWAAVVLVIFALLGGGAFYHISLKQEQAEDASRLVAIRREIAAATTPEALDQLERREPRLRSDIDVRRKQLAAIARSQRLALLREQIARETSAAVLDRIAAEEPDVRADVEARKLALSQAAARALRARIPGTTDLSELNRIAREAPELSGEVAARRREIEEIRRRDAVAALVPGSGQSARDLKSQSQSAWVKLCENANAVTKGKGRKDEKKEVNICVTIHERIDGNTGMVMLSAGVRQIEGQDKQVFMVIVPPGMQVPAGLGVGVYPKDLWEKVTHNEQIDESKLKRYTMGYSFCLPTGCTAELEVTPELLNELKSSGGLGVFAVNAGGQKVALPVPLVGFVDAFAGPPIDNQKFSNARKALIEQIKQSQQHLKK